MPSILCPIMRWTNENNVMLNVFQHPSRSLTGI